jgi:hypothetical protein
LWGVKRGEVPSFSLLPPLLDKERGQGVRFIEISLKMTKPGGINRA